MSNSNQNTLQENIPVVDEENLESNVKENDSNIEGNELNVEDKRNVDDQDLLNLPEGEMKTRLYENANFSQAVKPEIKKETNTRRYKRNASNEINNTLEPEIKKNKSTTISSKVRK